LFALGRLAVFAVPVTVFANGVPVREVPLAALQRHLLGALLSLLIALPGFIWRNCWASFGLVITPSAFFPIVNQGKTHFSVNGIAVA
jgi:hypothetical protein